MESRRLLALDYGFKRIGVALSDPLCLFAKPHSIIHRTTNRADFAIIKQIIDTEGVFKVVVGLPLRSHIEMSAQAEKVLRWARKLAQETTIPIVLWDESYSSETAASLKSTSARKSSTKPDRIDDLAAAVILQEYLDAGGAQNEPGRSLDSFAPQSD